MKCKIPEISWHNRDPVLSVDIQTQYIENAPHTYRLASGGTDAHVLIWYVNLAEDGSDINLELAAELTRHQRAVNVVKWSPNGELLASGDDESVIFIWKQTDSPNVLENTAEQDKEVWLTFKVLRGHMEDVYDLSWSPSSQFLVSGSVDNTAIIWDVYKGKSTAILSDHKGFVQGVAWDPCNQYLATLSTDRYLRIFDIQSKRVLQRINKGALNVPVGHSLHGRRMRLFHDDTLQTFFRRLSFTPDGKLLLTPAGVTDFEGCTKPLHTTYGFSRFSFRQPSLILPCPDQYTVAVSCCPLLYALRPYNPDANPPVIALPYRMVFAVATRSSVYFYDTQQHQPFAIISNIHYTRLTDITWSADGRVVIVSSTDGFCSLITFEKGELGEHYEKMSEVLTSVNLATDSTIQGNKKLKRQKEKENEAQEPKLQKSSGDDNKIKPKTLSLQKTLLKLIPESCEEKETKISDEEPRNETPKDTETDRILKHEPISTKTGSTAIIKPLLAGEIILDKEILSSDVKFESPEKKCRPVTPITVRRHPRTSNSGNKPTSTPSTTILQKSTLMIDVLKNSPQSEAKNTTHNPMTNLFKAATPIAVRRTPRAIIPIAPTAIDSPIVVEEAMDAWPIKIPLPPSTNEEKLVPETAERIPLTTNEITNEHTEDIRLVYEDTVEEETLQNTDQADLKRTSSKLGKSAPIQQDCPVVKIPQTVLENTPKQSKSETPTQSKTPRRVQLKTISAPKSKKKLL